jgi:hypothetical protein
MVVAVQSCPAPAAAAVDVIVAAYACGAVEASPDRPGELVFSSRLVRTVRCIYCTTCLSSFANLIAHFSISCSRRLRGRKEVLLVPGYERSSSYCDLFPIENPRIECFPRICRPISSPHHIRELAKRGLLVCSRIIPTYWRSKKLGHRPADGTAPGSIVSRA